jgi:hypothetical protein
MESPPSPLKILEDQEEGNEQIFLKLILKYFLAFNSPFEKGGNRGNCFEPPRRNPPCPPEGVKKFRQREVGGPGDARGRGKFTPPKPSAGFSVAGVGFNSLEPKRESFCFYKNIPKLPASLGGSRGSASRSSISRRVLAA